MNWRRFLICLVVLAFLFGLQIKTQAAFTFNRNLRLGSNGSDIKELQKFFNKNIVTQVANYGPGSPGSESNYFGSLTAKAVSRFQELYKAEILAPSGLTKATGFFGPSTRAKLNELINAPPVTLTPPANSTPLTTLPPTIKTDPAINPNLENLDLFLDAVKSASKKRGASDEKIKLVEQQIRIDVATTTNLREAFVKKALENPPGSKKPVSFWSSLRQLLSKNWLKPNTAKASGSSSFGGRIVYDIYCTCTGSWLLFITPLAPDYVTFLDYYEGSEAYLYYDLPFSINLLGMYSPPGICEIYVGEACVEMPSDGIISSEVGSS